MSDQIRREYQTLFAAHGNSHKTVQWSSRETQYERFRALAEPVGNSQSVADVGCGLGDLLIYLRHERSFEGSYLGLDFVPEFIDHCEQTFSTDSQAAFASHHLRSDEMPKGYDWYLLSGVFNNLIDDNMSFICESLSRMYEACEVGVSINALSTYVDYQDDGLYYTDPLALFDFCKRNLTSRVTLRHDYRVKPDSIPFEFTLYLFKG